jgi:hypothetical protein
VAAEKQVTVFLPLVANLVPPLYHFNMGRLGTQTFS